VGDLLRNAARAEGLEHHSTVTVDPLARALVGAGESLAVWWDEPRRRPPSASRSC
jgi:hypothetical protein